MGFIFGILPLLQALSAIASIWGVMHVSNTTDVIATYGVYGDQAPTAFEWLNSYGSLAFGVIGWISTKVIANKNTTNSELALSVLGWIKSPKDPSAIRRLAFATVDWVEFTYIQSNPNITEQEKTDWINTINWLRARFAQAVQPTSR